MMDEAAWRKLLQQWNTDLILNNANLNPAIPDDLLANGWLGNAGITPEELAKLEQRLGIPLPPSYRNFLQVSNGWNGNLDDLIYHLWKAEEVDWFSKRNSDWIEAWFKPYSPSYPYIPTPDDEYFVYGDHQEPYNVRIDYLPACLEISEEGDSAILLLNPKVIDANGEWEAWFFANWLPGAKRYKSFWDLMVDTHKKFQWYCVEYGL